MTLSILIPTYDYVCYTLVLDLQKQCEAFDDIDKYEIADIFENCAIDLFKYKKVLVYDKYQMKWIDYKIKFVRNVILDEGHNCHIVISKKNKREIYVIR